jgi:protein involved in polysaccharide export with SLBB domain
MKNLTIIIFTIFYALLDVNSFAQQLNAGDGIRISFLDITDLITGDYFIQPNGLVNLPIVGPIDTKLKDIKDLKLEIESHYDSLYKNPHLSVNALFRINILGEVKNPGFYYVSDYEKFTAILAFAGGTSDNADLDNIRLIRNNEQIDIDVNKIIQEGSTATDFGLRSGDQVYVPKTWWSTNSSWVTITISALALIITSYAIFFQN